MSRRHRTAVVLVAFLAHPVSGDSNARRRLGFERRMLATYSSGTS
jgi:hypothetical protein